MSTSLSQMGVRPEQRSTPQPLLKAILRGMAATRDSIKCTEQLQESDWDVTLAMSPQEPEAASEAAPSTSSIPKTG